MVATNAVPPSVVRAGAQAIAVGGYHSMVLKGDGTVWATGLNQHGELGDGTTSRKSSFVEVFRGQWGRGRSGRTTRAYGNDFMPGTHTYNKSSARIRA